MKASKFSDAQKAFIALLTRARRLRWKCTRQRCHPALRTLRGSRPSRWCNFPDGLKA